MKKIFLVAAVAIIFAGCKKKDGDDSEPAPAAPEAYYISCEIDGVKYTYTDKAKGYAIVPFTSHATSGPTDKLAVYSSTMAKNPRTLTQELSIAKWPIEYTGALPTQTQFEAFFQPQSCLYTRKNGNDNGVNVTFTDASGVRWESYYTTQTGSTFTITSAKARNVGTDNFMDIKGTFNCFAYPETAGPSLKVITKGKFYLTVKRQE